MSRYKVTYTNLAGKEMVSLRWAHTPEEACHTLAKQHMWLFIPKRTTDDEAEGCFFKNIRRVGPSEFGHVLAVRMGVSHARQSAEVCDP